MMTGSAASCHTARLDLSDNPEDIRAIWQSQTLAHLTIVIIYFVVDICEARIRIQGAVHTHSKNDQAITMPFCNPLDPCILNLYIYLAKSELPPNEATFRLP